jgi:hypothetical protein
MLITGFGSYRYHGRSSQQHGIRIGASALVLAIALICISCGSVSQADPRGNAGLVLSGSLPNGSVSHSYNTVLSVSGGSSPYQFSVASGKLPPGLTLNAATGSFTGEPSSAGNYTFAVSVTDSPRPDRGTQTYTVTIKNGGNGGQGIAVSISPSSATLSSGGTQQFTATVTGTANTAVTWSATAGSVSGSGLYTAPTVKSATSATVTATSQASSAQSASAAVTINPSQGQQSLQISTSSLPQGLQGETYVAAFSATGGTQPYDWSLTTGTLPAGLTLSTDGNLTGTPSALGTSGFSVMVKDANGKTATGTFGITTVASSGYDGPAQLPLVTVATAMADTPAPGAVINVNAGGDLQSALNSAQCGETIQLQAGATFNGSFTLPAKNCDNNHWIIVRTSSPDSALPAEGQRVTPCYGGVSSLEGRPAYNCPNPQNVLAKVQMPNPDGGPFSLANGANFYRLVGLELTRPIGVKGSAVLISIEDKGDVRGTADHIIVDRSWLHGQAQDETRTGMNLGGGTYIAIVDSYFNDFHCIADTGSCTDAHAIAGGNTETQDGPYLIQNNFLEASGEGVLFGGGPATKNPADIEIIGNHFWKPWQWMPGNTPFVGGPDGKPFIVKNHFELKNAVRVLFEANLLENVWGGFTQAGHAIVMSPSNQHSKSGANVCPLCQVTDVTMRYNQISHAGGGISLATEISPSRTLGAPALAGERWSLHDLVLDDLSTKYVGGGDAFKITNAWPKNPINTFTINHVTAFPDPTSHVMLLGNFLEDDPMFGFVFTNNLVTTGQHPVWNDLVLNSCSAGDVPAQSFAHCFTTYVFQNNGLIASPSAFPESAWPKENLFPATVLAVGFVNYNNGNGGNYALLPGSPYKNKGTDGKDLGADIAGLTAALAGVQ